MKNICAYQNKYKNGMSFYSKMAFVLKTKAIDKNPKTFYPT